MLLTVRRCVRVKGLSLSRTYSPAFHPYWGYILWKSHHWRVCPSLWPICQCSVMKLSPNGPWDFVVQNSDVSCRCHKNVDLSTLSACCVTSDDMSPTTVTSFAFQRCELCILKRHKDHIWSPLSTPGIRCAADLSSKDDYWGSSQCCHMSSRVDNCFAFRTRMLFEIFPIPMEHILAALVFTPVLVL